MSVKFTRVRRVVAVTAVLGAVGWGVAACGSDEEASSANPTNTSPLAAEKSPPSTDLDAFCDAMEELNAIDQSAVMTDLPGTISQIEGTVASFKKINPPEDVADDVTVVVEGFDQNIDQLKKVAENPDEDPIANAERVMEAVSPLSDEKFVTAVTRINSYSIQHCS